MKKFLFKIGGLLLLSQCFFLTLASADCDISKNEDWFFAARTGQINCLEKFTKNRFSINYENENGETALFQAIAEKQINSVTYLLKQPQINLNIATRAEGLTPLMAASILGQDKVVAALVSQNTLIDQVDLNNQTALIHAAKSGHLDTVKILLSAGVDFEKKDIFSKSASDWADSYGDMATSAVIKQEENLIVNWQLGLRKYNLNLDQKTFRQAILNNDLKCLKILLAAGFKINEFDWNGATPLDYATYNKVFDRTLNLLIKNNAFVTKYGSARLNLKEKWDQDYNKSFSFFLESIKSKDDTIFDLFVKAEITVMKSDLISLKDFSNFRNPLLFAAEQKNYHALKALLEIGPDLEWENALCLLYKNQDKMISEILFQHFSGGKSPIFYSSTLDKCGFVDLDNLKEIVEKRKFLKPRFPFPLPNPGSGPNPFPNPIPTPEWIERRVQTPSSIRGQN